MAIQIGQPAPNFALYNTDKKEISLAGLHGKTVVILFFPLAFTSTCTAELCSVRDNYHVYTALNAVVLGISVDSLFSLNAYKKEQSYNFDLLSDFNKDASRAYGVLKEDFIFGMKGVSKRAAFVVDKEGRIEYAEVLEDATRIPDFEAIRAVVEKIH